MKIIELSSWDKDKVNLIEKELDTYDGIVLRLGYRGIKSGKITMDSYFRNYLKMFKGRPIGVYFVTSAINVLEAREEARYCLDVIKTFNIELSFPIVIYNDACNSEENGRSDLIDKVKRTDCILAFIDIIEDAGYKACLYCKEDWFMKKLLSAKLMFKYKWFVGKSNSIRINYNLGYQDSIYGNIKESTWYGEISKEFAKL